MTKRSLLARIRALLHLLGSAVIVLTSGGILDCRSSDANASSSAGTGSPSIALPTTAGSLSVAAGDHAGDRVADRTGDRVPSQQTAITVDDKGFTPSSVSVKKGDHAQLVFTRTTDSTCATEVVFPEINLKKALPLKQPVTVDVPTDAARTLTFQCGMGMFKSSVVIH